MGGCKNVFNQIETSLLIIVTVSDLKPTDYRLQTTVVYENVINPNSLLAVRQVQCCHTAIALIYTLNKGYPDLRIVSGQGGVNPPITPSL